MENQNENLKVVSRNVPHTPYIIVDADYNLIATMHHTMDVEEQAELFANAPKMKNLLWRIFEEVSKQDDIIPISLELLNDITLMLTRVQKDKVQDWKDELYKKYKDDKLPDVFTENNNNNNKNESN